MSNNASNFINAKDLVDRLTQSFREHEKAIEDSAATLAKLDAEYAKLPSDYIKAQKEILALKKAQSQTEREVQKVLQDSEKALAARELRLQRESRTRQTLRREKEQEIRLEARAQKQRDREEQQAAKMASRYQRLNKILNNIRNEYRDLAIKKELNGKLTLKEEARLGSLTGRVQMLDKAFKKVDATMGVHNRNVGNYASGWNGMGNAINQLTREAPAFANSMQTGFMALSNNIPILADEIQNLRNKNALLRKEGKPTKSVLQSIGSALFSWQTALALGVTLLTLYGDELVNWIGDLAKSSDAVSKAERVNNDYSKSLAEVRNGHQAEVTSLKTLVEIARDENESREKRNQAVQILKKEYPKYLGNLDIEKATNEQLADAINKVSEALENKAKVQAAEQLISEKAGELFKKEIEAQEEYEARVGRINKALKATMGKTIDEIDANNEAEVSRARALIGNALDEANDERRAKLRIASGDYKGYVDNLKKIIKDLPDLFDVFGDPNEGGKGAKEKLKELSEIEPLGTTIEQAKEARKEMKALLDLFKGSTDLDIAKIDFAKITPDGFEKAFKQFSDTEGVEAALSNLSQVTSFYLSEIDEAWRLSGNNKYEHFKDFAEKIKEANNIMLNDQLAAQERFNDAMQTLVASGVLSFFEMRINKIDAAIDKNKEYYDTVLDSEKLSDEQRQVLEKQREKRDKELQKKREKEERKAFLVKQAFAVADIAIELSKTLAAINTTAAYLDSISFGVAGQVYRATQLPLAIGTAAAQTGVVIAQSLPQFAEGKDASDNYTGAMIWGEERPEIMRKKDGRLYMATKPTLGYTEAGDTIYSSVDDFFNENSGIDLQRAAWDLNAAQDFGSEAVDMALLREFGLMRQENKRLWREVKELATRPIENNVTINPEDAPY